MIRRILLDDADWLITLGVLGGLKVTNKAIPRTYKASRAEKAHLMTTIGMMESSGVPIEPNNQILKAVLQQFAWAVCGRGDVHWQAYFSHLTPESIAHEAIKDYMSRQTHNTPQSQELQSESAPAKEKKRDTSSLFSGMSKEELKWAILQGVALAEIDKRQAQFGCTVCRGTPARGTSVPDLHFDRIKPLYDSSHLIFWLSECSHCKQPYLEQFFERIDWSGSGNDPAWSRWTPLTHGEVEELNVLLESHLDPNALKLMMTRRQRLLMDPEREFSWSNSPADIIDCVPEG